MFQGCRRVVSFRVIVTLLLINFSLLALTAKAETSINLMTMDDEIRREPWLSYQKILTLEPQFSAMDHNKQLWWLLRKAHCENLLYFYDEFSLTVSQAQQLVTESTPVQVSSLLNVFEGMIARRNAQYKKAITFLNKALAQAKDKNLNIIYVIGKQEIAYTQSIIELYEISLTDLQEAYVEAFALEDDFLIAIINETYGAIYGYMQKYEKSIEYYEKAQDTYELLGFKAHIAEAIYGLASTYRYWKKYDLAIKKYELYNEKISYTPNTKITFFGTYGLGMTLAEQGSCERALVVIEQALQLNGLADYNAELYKSKARCLITLKQLNEAEIAISNAQDVFEELPELIGTTWQLGVIKIKSELAHAKGDELLAYQLLNEYEQKNTKLIIDNSNSRFIKVREAMDMERQQVELSLLKKKAEVQDLNIKQQNLRNMQQGYFIIFTLCLIIIIVGALIIQRKNYKKILALSITDPLSGLYNRRYIFNYLDNLLSNTTSDKAQLSVLLIDIDDFKLINDNYGHPFGDMVIQKIAEIGQSTLRAGDIMGRIGGEEFLCILPRINESKCWLIAERILENVSKHLFVTEYNQEVRVTVSIGFSNLIGGKDDSRVLYAQADQALYDSKKQGKNCVNMFSEIINEQ